MDTPNGGSPLPPPPGPNQPDPQQYPQQPPPQPQQQNPAAPYPSQPYQQPYPAQQYPQQQQYPPQQYPPQQYPQQYPAGPAGGDDGSGKRSWLWFGLAVVAFLAVAIPVVLTLANRGDDTADPTDSTPSTMSATSVPVTTLAETATDTDVTDSTSVEPTTPTTTTPNTTTASTTAPSTDSSAGPTPIAPTGTEFTDPEGKYTITLDSDWDPITQGVGVGVEMWQVGPEVDNFPPSVNVYTQRQPGATIEDFADVKASDIGPGITILDQKLVKSTSGADAALIEYTGKLVADRQLHFMAVVVIGDGEANVVTFATDPTQFEELRPKVEPYMLTIKAS